MIGHKTGIITPFGSIEQPRSNSGQNQRPLHKSGENYNKTINSKTNKLNGKSFMKGT